MFKVGDRVRVKDLRGKGGTYSKSRCYLAYEMVSFSGMEFIIRSIAKDGDMYFENCGWSFAKEWVEPVEHVEDKPVEHVECDMELVSDKDSIETAIMQHERQIDRLKRMLEVTEEFKKIGITVKFFQDKIEL